MNRRNRLSICRFFALLLAFSLALPNPVQALRVLNPGDNPPVLSGLRAGMEEPVHVGKALTEETVQRRLEGFKARAGAIGPGLRGEDPGARANNPYVVKLVGLMRSLVDLRHPSRSAREVRRFLGDMDAELIQPLLQAGPEIQSEDLEEFRRYIAVFPTAEDWLAYPLLVYQNDKDYARRTRAVAAYSPRASAFLFGRNGPHLRADISALDRIDIQLAPDLLAGFAPHLESLMNQVQENRAGKREDPSLEKEAREYAGALFNGLIIPVIEPRRKPFNPLLVYEGYFKSWMAELRRQEIRGTEGLIGQAAFLFPDLFPKDRKQMAKFLWFSNYDFAHEEAMGLARFNQESEGQPPISLWDLTVGAPHALPYIEKLFPKWKDNDVNHLTRTYGFVLQRGRQALSAAGLPAGQAGMEEPRGSITEEEVELFLDSLRKKTSRELGSEIKWGSPRSIHQDAFDRYVLQLVAVMKSLLDHPDPKAVSGKVREILWELETGLLRPVLQLKPDGARSEALEGFRQYVILFSNADDWLAYPLFPYQENESVFIHQIHALAVYSVRGSALAFGRNGPHLRADFQAADAADILTAPDLLQGFLPYLDTLLSEIQKNRTAGRVDEILEREARQYAGALFNGLVIPAGIGNRVWKSPRMISVYESYFNQWTERLEQAGVRPQAIIGRAAAFFPDLLPNDPAPMPDFLKFSNDNFGHQEAVSMLKFNRRGALQPLSMWDLTVGERSAEPYMRQYSSQWKDRSEQQHLSEIYTFILQRGREALSAAGMEERVEEHPLLQAHTGTEISADLAAWLASGMEERLLDAGA